MDLPVRNFVVVVGNSVDFKTLESFRLLRMVKDTSYMGGRASVRGVAVDVNVFPSPASRLLNTVLGRPTVINGLDLDKERELLVSEDLLLPVKDGTPSVSIALPTSFDELPRSWKDSPFLGDAFRIAYLARKQDEATRQLLKEAGRQSKEIDDILASAHKKMDNYVNEFMEKRKSDISADAKKLPKTEQTAEY